MMSADAIPDMHCKVEIPNSVHDVLQTAHAKMLNNVREVKKVNGRSVETKFMVLTGFSFSAKQALNGILCVNENQKESDCTSECQ